MRQKTTGMQTQQYVSNRMQKNPTGRVTETEEKHKNEF